MAKRINGASTAIAIKQRVGDLPPDRKGTDGNIAGTDPVIVEARARWKRCEEASDEQRKSILDAKKFRAGDQWPKAVRTQREGATAIQGQAAQPPRPCLTIDRLSQPARELSNEIKGADFGFDVSPNGFGADDEVATIIKGYFRRVQNDAAEDEPIEWGADGAIEGGIGWFRIRTDYVHETWDGDPNDPEAYDQELRLERITNNLSVSCDPSAMKPTRSDARYMFVVEDLERDDFRSRWPKADLNSLDDFSATGNDMPGWVTNDSIRIAEYWRITYTDRKLTNGTQTRVTRVPKVEGFKISATEVLERWDWLGSRIPLIPILGEELNVDGKPVLRGIIQEGMDAQRMVNYTYSAAVETFALLPKSPFVAAAGQIDPYKDYWQFANVYNLSYLPYEPISISGTVLPPPQATQRDGQGIQAAVALMLKSEEAIKATTGVFDPSLEYNNQREHSGTALESLKDQSNKTSSNYSMNVRRAMTYAGNLMVEIMPKLTRPGQILQIIGADDKPEQIVVGHPFEPAKDGQSPKPLQDGQPMLPDLHKFYDLTKGQYAVTVTIGKAAATRREEGAQALGALIPHLPPEMAMVATPDYVRQLSFDGSEKIATKLEKALPPQLQDQEDGQPDPALQAAQQQIQQLTQALESKHAEEMAKGQIDLQKAQMANQAKLQESQMEIQSRERIAYLQSATTLAATQAKIDAEDARTFMDAVENKVGAALELHMKRLGMVHEQQQQIADHAHEAALAIQDHAHTLEQGMQAAALAPEPTTGGANA